MKDEELYSLFTTEEFDIEEPRTGHEERFLTKLKEEAQQKEIPKDNFRSFWSPWLAIAASLVFIIIIAGSFFSTKAYNKSTDLAAISPEMKETQEFYSTAIKAELEKVNLAKSPETEIIVNDALKQLERLDTEYKKLKQDLSSSGKDKRVIFAMVSNLQQRIDLLNNVSTQIEEIKELKNKDHESTII